MPIARALRESTVTFLREQPSVEGLDASDLQQLIRVGTVLDVPAGATILTEGQEAGRLFFVLSGAVEILKRPREDDLAQGCGPDELPRTTIDRETFVITRLGKGAILGEMSFLDGEPVSASVRAAEDCSLFVVDRAALRQTPEAQLAEQHLTRGLAVTVIRRLRDMSTIHVKTLQSELAQSRLRVEFARFFVVTMILFGIASTVQKLINTGLSPLWQMLYSWGFLLLSFAPIAWFAVRQGQRRRDFGLTFNGWQRSLSEAGLLSAALLIAAAAVRLSLREAGEPLLTWGSIASYSQVEVSIFLLAYGPHCLLQEFIGRGVIQTSLARLMPEARPFVPILMTSALFGIFHFYVSVSFALTTFVVSLVFGWLYHRHRSLLGVTLVHLVLGLGSIAFGFN